jgi:hypothetical protein
MRLFAFAFVVGWCNALAAQGTSALEALRCLPPVQSANLVRIEGRDGSPVPERWYLVVFDPASENGVREFVVAKNQLVASRNLSQFVESASAVDRLDVIQVDSDRAQKVAAQYAEANAALVSQWSYTLTKTEGQSAWHLAAINESGMRCGELIVSATSAVVLGHPGFSLEPAPPSEKKRKVVSAIAPKIEAPRALPVEPVAESPAPKRRGGLLNRIFSRDNANR